MMMAMVVMVVMSGGIGRWRRVRTRMSGRVGRAPAETRAKAQESTGTP